MLTSAERIALAKQAGVTLPSVAALPTIAVPDVPAPATGLTMPSLVDPSEPPEGAELLPPSWSREMFDVHKANKKEVGAAAASLHNKELWSRLNAHRAKWNATLKRRNA